MRGAHMVQCKTRVYRAVLSHGLRGFLHSCAPRVEEGGREVPVGWQLFDIVHFGLFRLGQAHGVCQPGHGVHHVGVASSGAGEPTGLGGANALARALDCVSVDGDCRAAAGGCEDAHGVSIERHAHVQCRSGEAAGHHVAEHVYEGRCVRRRPRLERRRGGLEDVSNFWHRVLSDVHSCCLGLLESDGDPTQ